MHAGTGATLHNRYDLLRYRAFAEGEARDRGDARPSCCAAPADPACSASARGPGPATSTIRSRRSKRRSRMGLNVGMSGVPYWGTDIGGYYPTAEASGELFARWFQFGAFCPLFRAHGRAWRERLPWSYGSEIEAICRRYLELRYRLMPYTYTLAWQAHRERPAAHAAAGAEPSRTIRAYGSSQASTCGATICSWRPSRARAQPIGPSICPRVAGTISGLTRSMKVLVASPSRRRSTGCRSSCAPAPLCRWGPLVQHLSGRRRTI